ncbi:MAG: filamentous hemagglutinin N-terminal domain-containing protein [Cyanobacteria bacterium J06639_18]
MESYIKQQENLTVIDGGVNSGTNLFHSLKHLSVSWNHTVYFNNPLDIENIFIAVRDESISNIDGLIKANGIANLFLINTNGIIFGKNSSLDVGGSFLASTTSSIKFADGFEFGATDSSVLSLTSSTPVSLVFVSDTGEIQVQDLQDPVERKQKISPIFRGIKPSGLFVQPGNTLALIGGNLNLDGATLTVEDGQIELGSVGKDSFVSLTQNNKRWDLNYDKASLRDITLSNRTLLDTSGVTGGSVQIQGADVKLDSSGIRVQSLGTQEQKSLKVNASESLELRGSPASNLTVSTIGLRDINILSLKFQELVKNEGVGIGKPADTVVKSKNLRLIEGSSIGCITNNKADGGKVIINAESIEIVGSSPLNRSQYSRIISFTTGDTDTDGNFIRGGKAGNINISTKYLTAKDGGQIAGSSIGSGEGGNLIINSTNSIGIVSPQSFLGSKSFNVGNAGNVTISTTKLTATDGGRVDTSTLGPGSAGSITIDAQSVNLSGTDKALGRLVPSSITSSANIPSQITQKYFGIPAMPSGKSGEITINTEELNISNGAEVSVKNEGTGNAGILKINAGNINLEDFSGITATSTSGEGGIIEINTTKLFNSPKSQITASSKEGVDGTIQVNFPDMKNEASA